ncbi:MAG: hypothetical protein R8G60_05780 [Roseovarius pacificus]|nr:hypothetical protein [Roseovarius pacificus]
MRRLLFFAALTVLAGCADPMDKVVRLSDQDVAEDAPMLDVARAPDPEETAGGGFLARLLNRSEGSASLTDDTMADDGASATGGETQTASVDDGATAPDRARSRRGGFFGLLSSGASKPDDPATAATSDIPPGTVLPYGRVARICGLSLGQMGKVIASYPERRPVHRLYDSDPGNTAPHTFYLSGFGDGCARQFTASLAVFGTVEMHEQLRYGLPAEVQPYSDTDKAYEKVKSRVCGVPQRKPCGTRIRRLEKDTVFLSIYERFGGNADWTNLLLHGGDVVAQDRKGG